MGLFSNTKKYEPIYSIVFHNYSEAQFKKLSEKEVLAGIQVYLVSSERILQDCATLVNNTDNIETFLKRYEKLIEILYNWSIISITNNKIFKNGNPQRDYNNVIAKRDATERDAIDRYMDKENKAIFMLGTERAKQQRFQKAVKLLLWHLDKFSKENQTYINELMKQSGLELE